MLEQAMLRQWRYDWMEEIKKGVEETEKGFRRKVDDISARSEKIDADIGDEIGIASEEIRSLSNRAGKDLSESKDRIMKEIMKMESKIIKRLDDLDEKMNDKKEIAI